MQDYIRLHYEILSSDFIRAGEASSDLKRSLLKLGVNPVILKRICIACYEAEMNIVIHSKGGSIDVLIDENTIEIVAKDKGPGIENINLAMMEGFSTAPDIAREMGFGAGMGLPNMKKSSSNFTIDSCLGIGTTVRMVINIAG